MKDEDLKMKTRIFCRTTTKGIHTFYLNSDGKEYYLFHQDYRKGVAKYYRNGVTLTEAMNFSRSGHDSAIMKTMQKLPIYLKYAEKEYGIYILDKTIKKNQKHGNYRIVA